MTGLNSHFRLSKSSKVRLATYKCKTNAEYADFKRFLIQAELGEKKAKSVQLSEKVIGE